MKIADVKTKRHKCRCYEWFKIAKRDSLIR